MPTSELADCGDVSDAPPDALRGGQLLWATLDSPWVHNVDQDAFRRTVQPLREMDPEVILSSHLPPAPRHTTDFLDLLETAPQADAFVGPDQQALEEMLASFEPAASAPA